MNTRSDAEANVLGDPPPAPDHVWEAALAHAFDPWAVPDTELVVDDALDAIAAVDDTDLVWAGGDGVGESPGGSHFDSGAGHDLSGAFDHDWSHDGAGHGWPDPDGSAWSDDPTGWSDGTDAAGDMSDG